MEKKNLQNTGSVKASSQNWCTLSHFSGKNKSSGQVWSWSGVNRTVLSLGGVHLAPSRAHQNSEIPLEATLRISILEAGDIPCLHCGSFLLLGSISLYGYTTIWSTHLLADVQVVSQVWALTNEATINTSVTSFYIDNPFNSSWVKHWDSKQV